VGLTRPVAEYVQHAAFSAGAEDAHGNLTDSWGAAKKVGIYAFDPGSSSEPRLPGQDRVVTEPTLYLPSDVVFGQQDQVTVRGNLYQVDGETREWVHPSDPSRRANVATLRRVTG